MSATKKLKIALLIKHLSFPINGFIQDLVWQLYKHLSLMGNEVTLVKGVSRRHNQVERELKNVRILRLVVYQFKVLGFRLLFLTELWFNIIAIIKLYQYRNYFDVIHIQGRNGVLLNLFNRLFPNIVTTIHDLTKEEYEAHITYDKLPKKYRSELFLHHLVFGFIENVCLQKANNVILVSDKLNNYIRALNPDINLHIVPNGTNLHGVSSYTKPIKFLFPGRVEGGKGVHTLIEAFKQVSKVRDNVELIIAGEGILSRNIREIIVKEKLQNKISLTGRINEEEKNQILSESYAIIYPSFSEGKGIAAIEAMSFGKPVIASDIPGLKRVCE